MSRRTTNQEGFVNFPTHLRNTNEGGTFVRLIVREKEKNTEWMQCIGGYNFFFMDESYCGNDVDGSFIGNYTNPDEWQKKYLEFERNIFPNYANKETKIRTEKSYGEMGEFLSCYCLCVMTIGSTGWTGVRENGDEWICGYDDLTQEGKKLYDSIKNLYENCEILLLTFVDT